MFYVGLDLGLRVDYSAIALVERVLQEVAWQEPAERRRPFHPSRAARTIPESGPPRRRLDPVPQSLKRHPAVAAVADLSRRRRAVQPAPSECLQLH